MRDTGPGIAESTRVRLFQRFEQAQGTQQRFGGSGLGLAICRRLAGLMQGALAVESEPGRGSVFSLMLALPEAGGEGEARAD